MINMVYWKTMVGWTTWCTTSKWCFFTDHDSAFYANHSLLPHHLYLFSQWKTLGHSVLILAYFLSLTSCKVRLRSSAWLQAVWWSWYPPRMRACVGLDELIDFELRYHADGWFLNDRQLRCGAQCKLKLYNNTVTLVTKIMIA